MNGASWDFQEDVNALGLAVTYRIGGEAAPLRYHVVALKDGLVSTLVEESYTARRNRLQTALNEWLIAQSLLQVEPITVVDQRYIR